MTTTEVKVLVGSIRDILNQVEQCASDSELDGHHEVIDHEECLDDLKDIANAILEAIESDTI